MRAEPWELPARDAGRSRSRTTTSRPRRARCQAVEAPASPAPITTCVAESMTLRTPHVNAASSQQGVAEHGLDLGGRRGSSSGWATGVTREPASRSPGGPWSGADVGGEVLAGEGGAPGCEGGRWAFEDDPAAVVARAGTEVDDPVGVRHDCLVVLDDDDRLA